VNNMGFFILKIMIAIAIIVIGAVILLSFKYFK